ncbi:MAG: GIY-YIG nuclease family protein [Spirochaetales bacterium]|jgi:excinuclease ABC subunit C|nr:GIY-YIG nuclease family protein [Spirochaetales bacterium]
MFQPSGRRNVHGLAAIAEAPRAPGVYLFYSDVHLLLYVGKAIDLRRRLRQHFPVKNTVSPRPTRQQTAAASTSWVSWVLCESELHALVLEDKIIKDHLPITNKKQKKFLLQQYITLEPADKGRFTSGDISSIPHKKGTEIFGPFSDRFAVKNIFEIAAGYFGISGMVPGITFLPAGGPTEGAQNFRNFLIGSDDLIMEIIEERMKRSAEERRFEEAAKHRETLAFCSRFLDRQRFIRQFADNDLEISGESNRWVFHRGAFLDNEDPDYFASSSRPWLLFDRALVVLIWLGKNQSRYRYRFIQ